MDRSYLVVPSIAVVGNYLKSFKEFPPRQRPATFSIDQIIEKREAATAKN
jgi:hypothetical protein